MQRKQNTESPIKHEPVYALGDILALKSVAVLKRLAGSYGTKGYSGMTKPALVQAITSVLLEKQRMADTLTLADDTEWDFLQYAAKCRNFTNEDAPASVPLFLLGIGYVEAFQHGDKLVYVIPDEIKQSLQSLMESGYGEEWAHITRINKYALAATSLYGIITVDEFVEIFNSQNDRKTHSDEVCRLLMRYIASNVGYCFWDEYIVNDGFEQNGFKDVTDLARMMGSKPRYLPPKEEFLRYANGDYFEMTPQAAALRNYMNDKKLFKDSGETDSVLAEIQSLCAQESDMQAFMNIFKKHGVHIISAGQIQELSRYIMNVMNNTRLWGNKGHTPDEILRKTDYVPQKPVQNQPYRVKKTGRNEPCPCGSGKKYKKCCGH